MRTRPLRFRLAPAWLGPALLVLAGCRSEMYDQPRYEPLEPGDFFADGQSSRPVIPGTVAQLNEKADPQEAYFHESRLGPDAAHASDEVDRRDTFPFPIARADLVRGRQRYEIFCLPCHGASGDGNGMIVQRGFPPPPPFYGQRQQKSVSSSTPVSLYNDLREAPVGHFYAVITNGHGAMYSYASRIPPDDRWRIAAYIRALQFSQHATADDLKAIPEPNADERRLLQEVGR